MRLSSIPSSRDLPVPIPLDEVLEVSRVSIEVATNLS
jgi:hypothetical protein